MLFILFLFLFFFLVTYFENKGRELMQGRSQAWTMGGNGPPNFFIKKLIHI